MYSDLGHAPVYWNICDISSPKLPDCSCVIEENVTEDAFQSLDQHLPTQTLAFKPEFLHLTPIVFVLEPLFQK